MRDFIEEPGCLDMLLIIALIALIIGGLFGCSATLQYFGIQLPTPPAPMDVYENSYKTCIARETLSDAQCHDIALKEAYPDD